MAFVAVVLLVVLGYTVYLFRPLSKTVFIKTCSSRFRTEYVKSNITLDGKSGTIEIPFCREVPQTQTVTRVISPSPFERLRFWVLAGAAVLVGGFFLAVMVLWVTSYAKGKTPPKAIDIQLASGITFTGGLVLGLLLNAPMSAPYGCASEPGAVGAERAKYELPWNRDFQPGDGPVLPGPDPI